MCAETRKPIVNIVNFLRGVEPRYEGRDLYEPARHQLDLMKEHGLTGTWLLQYDAMIQPQFEELAKEALEAGHEVGAWFELNQPQVEAAGLPWRGRAPWDHHAHVGFSVGYTPQEREALIDVMMTGFQERFGCLPKSVGSWMIDAHSLGYMADKYDIVASCNCKDQWGTDGYTMWGGYWSQAYYPSRKNGFMPAQTMDEQIPLPVFRMLGSDPIYQLLDKDWGEEGNGQGVVTLEPVYYTGGGDPKWVRWFFDLLCEGPNLSFGYAQAGQENSFGWESMEKGIRDQFPLIAQMHRAGKLCAETLADSGAWFRKTYPQTPASSMTALSDWKDQGNRSVWYQSRHYRANLMWEDHVLRFSDLHHFDESYAERYLTEVCTGKDFHYDTLPVMDEFRWRNGEVPAFLRLSRIAADGTYTAAKGEEPTVDALDENTLQITWPLKTGDTATLRLTDTNWEMHLPKDCVLEWSAGNHADTTITPDGQTLCFVYEGHAYNVAVCATITPTENGFILSPENGRIAMNFA